jgi:uncharacterized protein YjbI with pentapeptide repeats
MPTGRMPICTLEEYSVTPLDKMLYCAFRGEVINSYPIKEDHFIPKIHVSWKECAFVSSIEGKTLDSTNFDSCNFDEIEFKNCSLARVTFYRCSFVGTVFTNCDLRWAKFIECDTTSMSLHSVNTKFCDLPQKTDDVV